LYEILIRSLIRRDVESLCSEIVFAEDGGFAISTHADIESEVAGLF